MISTRTRTIVQCVVSLTRSSASAVCCVRAMSHHCQLHPCSEARLLCGQTPWLHLTHLHQTAVEDPRSITAGRVRYFPYKPMARRQPLRVRVKIMGLIIIRTG
jgi:hypothetical protein